MDQVKKYLALAGKHHFWILLVLAVLVAGGLKFKASSDLAAATASKEGSISSAFTGVQGQLGKDLTNATFLPEIDKRKKQVEADTRQAWEALYTPQRDLFTWNDLGSPKLRDYLLSPSFLDFLQSKPGVEIPQDLREYYRAHVTEMLPQLWHTVNLVREVPVPPERAQDRPAGGPRQNNPRRRGTAGGLSGANRGGRPGAGDGDVETEMVGLVEWPSTERETILSRYTWAVGDPPSGTAIRIAQEDFWITRALLEIIAATNEGATDHANAPVPTINHLLIAQRAIEAQNKNPGALSLKIENPSIAVAAAPKIPAPGVADTEWFDQRYVDDTGKPAPPQPPGTPPTSPYKLMPVYFDLVIDQATLPKFIGNCVNARLPVRIRQVRIVAAGSDTGGKAGAAAPTPQARPGGGGMSGGMGGGGMRGSMGGGGMRGGGMTVGALSGTSSGPQNLRPNDLHVTIFGSVTIYNPPPIPPDQLAAGQPVGPPPVIEEGVALDPNTDAAGNRVAAPADAAGEAGAAGDAAADAAAPVDEAAAGAEVEGGEAASPGTEGDTAPAEEAPVDEATAEPAPEEDAGAGAAPPTEP